MEIIRCSYCSQDIFRNAPKCPKCGRRNKQEKYLSGGQVFGGLLGGFLMIWWLASADDPQATPNKAKSAAEVHAEKRQLEYSHIEAGKLAIKELLKDPDSAKFTDVVFNQGASGVPVACGYVNSKNGFGGYNGNQRFISAGTHELSSLEEQTSDFQKLWDDLCK